MVFVAILSYFLVGFFVLTVCEQIDGVHFTEFAFGLGLALWPILVALVALFVCIGLAGAAGKLVGKILQKLVSKNDT